MCGSQAGPSSAWWFFYCTNARYSSTTYLLHPGDIHVYTCTCMNLRTKLTMCDCPHEATSLSATWETTTALAELHCEPPITQGQDTCTYTCCVPHNCFLRSLSWIRYVAVCAESCSFLDSAVQILISRGLNSFVDLPKPHHSTTCGAVTAES